MVATLYLRTHFLNDPVFANIQQGFGFDKVSGDVSVQHGVARTDNLRIVGVQAAVLIEGSADLQAETQDLRIVAVPEINDGSVEIAAIAREAGHRTKIAVHAVVPGVNAKGSCIGPMGQRVRNIMSELHGEKIDIVDWSEDPAEMIAHALSPARVSSVEIVSAQARSARVVVPDFQLSLAIGKEGQNARLAARLTGWRIDIRSDEETPEPAAD